MVEIAACLLVTGDVDVVQLQFTAADQAETISQIGLACTDGLDLGAKQFDACLEGFKNLVLVPRLAVVRQ